MPVRPPQPTRIAIVEDQAGVADSLKKLINRARGLQVIGTYPNGEAALEDIPRQKPDLVLMDIGLPGMSGIECVRALKAQLPALPIVMLTVYDEGEYLFDSLKAGASGYLLKRATGEKLLEAITEARLGGVPLTRQMAGKMALYFQRLGATTSEMGTLTKRERETLVLLAEGFRYKEIADRLGIGIETVREYVRNVYRKLHVSSRTEAVVKYLKK
ncbi:MAG TPA: response regulator transcription factor [Candidatus Acidoferrum sp.]|nr:response regulator transcription factor [Candidatus Acidoferrum sp.]